MGHQKNLSRPASQNTRESDYVVATVYLSPSPPLLPPETTSSSTKPPPCPKPSLPPPSSAVGLLHQSLISDHHLSPRAPLHLSRTNPSAFTPMNPVSHPPLLQRPLVPPPPLVVVKPSPYSRNHLLQLANLIPDASNTASCTLSLSSLPLFIEPWPPFLTGAFTPAARSTPSSLQPLSPTAAHLPPTPPHRPHPLPPSSATRTADATTTAKPYLLHHHCHLHHPSLNRQHPLPAEISRLQPQI